MMMAAMKLVLLLLLASTGLGSVAAAKQTDEFGWMAAEMVAEGSMLSDGSGPQPQQWNCKYPHRTGLVCTVTLLKRSGNSRRRP